MAAAMLADRDYWFDERMSDDGSWHTTIYHGVEDDR